MYQPNYLEKEPAPSTSEGVASAQPVDDSQPLQGGNFLRNGLIVGSAFVVAVAGAAKFGNTASAEASLPVDSKKSKIEIGSNEPISASSLAISGKLKKCRRGKPALQMRLVGSDPLTRHPRNKDLFMASVPAIGTPVHQELQIKSCKKIKGVTVEVLGRKEDNHRWRKVTLKANKVSKFGYDVTFDPPNPEVNNYDTPNSPGNSSKGMSLKAFTKTVRGRSTSIGSRIGYLYTDEQMAAMAPTAATGPTGPTAP